MPRKTDETVLKVYMFYSLLLGFLFLYQELLYKLLTGIGVDNSIFVTVFYCLFVAFVLGVILTHIPEKARKTTFTVLSFIISFFYGAGLIIYRVFGIVMTPASLSLAKNFTGDFLSNTISILFNSLWIIALVLVPFVLEMYILYKKGEMKEGKYAKAYSIVLMALFDALFFVCTISNYNPRVYEQYFDKNNYTNSTKTLGVLPTLLISSRKNITGFEEKIIFVEPEEIEEEDLPVDYEKQTLNIPFHSIQGDNTIQMMNRFFKNEQYTYKNEYTGLFEGKNLIYIMAESFDGYMVNEKLTPTLYKMIHQGFDFTNYYSPTNLSTIGGEFSLLTGLLPDLNCLNRQWIRVTERYDNYYPYGLANIFKNKGYKTYAYHDHEYDFQSRNVYLESLGFDNYLGCWNGLEERMGCRIFPKSDDEMINATYQDYINDDKFMVYYATVSGHGGWQFGDNDMSDKNKEFVEDLPYSSIVKGYIAANLELEKAMTSLLKALEENGRLQDTVIIMAADHHPYFLDDQNIMEMAGKELDRFEIYRNNLIIYNCDVENTKIEKVCNTIDVFPTMLNLFNIPYDSRIIIGKDIFSTNEGLVLFADYSWKSDKGAYSTFSGKFVADVPFDDEQAYFEKTNSIAEGRYLMSEYIMLYDYYRVIKDYLN